MRGLGEKTVIVTGGAAGIGKALCRRFAEHGSRVAILDLQAGNAAALALELGANVRAYGLDITDAGAVADTVARVHADFGPVDVLVNNAGLNHPCAFIASDPTHWQAMIANNLVGPLNMHHAVLPGMTARGRGRIVNVASDAGRVGSPNEAVYSACKGGIIAFSKAVARELARHQITVNVVSPGPTETGLFRAVAGEGERAEQFRAHLIRATPLGRIGQPDDIAGAVCFLASEDAAFITGQVLSVSGGLTMIG
jgi:2-hydroxycyclohexanecarboxyl-CoA dehydrogenase